MGVEASFQPAARLCLPATDDDTVTSPCQRHIEKTVFLFPATFLFHLACGSDKIRPYRAWRPIDEAAVRIAHKLV